MSTEQQWIFNRIAAIAAMYVFYRLIKPYLKPLPPNPNPTMLRKILRSYMRSKRKVPKLCARHVPGLKLGQMALLDTQECDTCTHNAIILAKKDKV